MLYRTQFIVSISATSYVVVKYSLPAVPAIRSTLLQAYFHIACIATQHPSCVDLSRLCSHHITNLVLIPYDRNISVNQVTAGEIGFLEYTFLPAQRLSHCDPYVKLRTSIFPCVCVSCCHGGGGDDDRIDVTEGQLAVIVLYILTACFGTSFWDRQVPVCCLFRLHILYISVSKGIMYITASIFCVVCLAWCEYC